ncbi:hypothetical protein [Xanthobacter autotrophicus]|uniref:hypothetical protein n=1 Tax=Xanthobacter autotrophicus TaxID=280 RepID=UPI003729FC12
MDFWAWNAGVTTSAGLVLGAISSTLITSAAIGNGDIELKDWLQFIGTLIGAAATIGAGVAAWIAVQRQIREPREHAIETIDVFAMSAQVGTQFIANAIKKLMNSVGDGPKKLIVIDVNAEHSEITKFAEMFNRSIARERYIDHAHTLAPAIICLRCEQLQASIEKLRDRLSNEKYWSDLKTIIECAKSTYDDAESVRAAIQEYRTGK